MSRPLLTSQRLLRILWPAFLMAGVLDGMLFAVIDPGDLRWFGGEPFGWPAAMAYSATFLLFWAVISVAGALTLLLCLSADEINAPTRRRDPGDDAVA